MAAVEIPTLFGFTTRSFQLGRKQTITASGQGAIQSIDRATPMWYAEYTTPPLSDDRYNAGITFLESLEGSSGSFLGYDPLKIMPYAYKGLNWQAADPWTQAGQTAPRITSYDYLSSQVNLDRLDPAAILSVGDFISVFDSPCWRLFRIQSVNARGGNTATVAVQPRPVFNIVSPANLNVRYRRAVAEMKIIGGYKDSSQVDSRPVLSFKAYQFIQR
jgi:hypothetical protein